jgi:hypothetical protein
MIGLETLLMLKIQLDNMVLVELMLRLAVKFIKQVKNPTSKTFTNYKTSTKHRSKKLTTLTQTTTKSIKI